MRTLGTPTQLRLQFDQGYKFMLAVDALQNEASASPQPQPSASPSPDPHPHPHRAPNPDQAAATAFATALMPGAAVRDSINGVVTFDVPKANVVMSRLFEQMEGNKERLHIKDWGLSHTTLEEVRLATPCPYHTPTPIIPLPLPLPLPLPIPLPLPLPLPLPIPLPLPLPLTRSSSRSSATLVARPARPGSLAQCPPQTPASR